MEFYETIFLFLIISNLYIIKSHSKSISVLSNATYWEERNQLLEEDLDQMLGNDLTLSEDEEEVNNLLMSFKNEEMNIGFESLVFSPSQNFMAAKPEIDKSLVFNFIRQMPKGASLHTHDMAMASTDWLVSNLTYWDDLYMCNSSDNNLLFKFFNIPNDLCNWKLVRSERAQANSVEKFDAYLFSRLSLYREDVKIAYPDINSIWEAFEQVFDTIDGLVNYVKAWESYLARAMQEFVEDGILYMEFRGVLPLLYEKDGRIHTEDETAGVYRDVIQNFTTQNSDIFLGARFIYAPYRLVDEDTVWNYVSLTTRLRDLYPTLIAGFDLVGQEDLGEPLTSFIDPILSLSQQDPPIPVLFHAGETNWEGMSSDENLFDALLLNSTRIGHGYAISKHPQLMQMARDKDIPIEVCPISNQILMLVDDLRNHPAATLAANSFPIVVCSDDPSIWEALPLSHDFYEAFMGLGGAKSDLRFLKKLALNSIRYSSLNDDQKVSLENMWQGQWDTFIGQNVIKNELLEVKESNLICRK